MLITKAIPIQIYKYHYPEEGSTKNIFKILKLFFEPLKAKQANNKY